MGTKEDKLKKKAELRAEAELKLEGALKNFDDLPSEKMSDVKSLVHEVQVYSIELELQNQELMETQNDLVNYKNKLEELFDFAPVGYLILDEDSIIHNANLTICSLLKVDRSKILNKKLYSFIEESDDKDDLFKALRTHFKTGKKSSFEIDFIDGDGNNINTRIEIAKIENSETDRKGCRVAVSDVTQLKKAQLEKEHFEKRFRTITELTSDYTYEFKVLENNQLELLWVSGAFKNITGFTPEESENRGGWLKLIYPEDLPIAEERAKKLLNGEEDRSEFRIVCKDGAVKWIRDYGKPIIENKKVVGIIGGAKDISIEKDKEFQLKQNYAATLNLVEDLSIEIDEKAKAESKLKESETFLSKLLESIPIPVFYKDTEGKYLGVNRAFEEFIGMKQEAIIGKSVFDLNPKELAKIYYENDKSLFENGSTQKYESEVATAKGDIRNVIFNKAVFSDNSGKVNGLIGTILDVTEERKSRKELEESEEKFRTLAEGMDDYILRYDKDHRHTYANPAALKLAGMSEEEFLGKTHRELGFDPILCDLWEEKIDNVFNTGQPDGAVFELESAEGRVYLDWKVNPEFDANGNVFSALAVSRDITNIKKTEAELIISEKRFRGIFENTLTAIFVADDNGNYITVNQAAVDLTGYSSDELGNMKVSDLQTIVKPGAAERYNEFIKRGHETGEFDFINKDGTEKIGHYHAVRVKPDFNLSVMYDVTEKKKAEEKLIESEEKYRTLHENMNEGYAIDELVFDENGNVTDWIIREINPTYTEIVNMEPSEILNKKASEIYADISDISERLKLYSDVDRSGKSKKIDITIESKGRTYLSSIIPYKPGFIAVAFTDITNLIRAEEALGKSEQEMREVLNNSLDGILLTAPDGSIYSANFAACEMFGRTEKDLCRIGRDSIIDMEDPRLKGFLETRKKKGKARAEVSLIRKDGSKFPAEVTSSLFKDTDGNIRSSMIIRDITERKIAEKKLEKSKERFELAMQASQDGLYDWNLETNEIYYSPGWKKMLGYEYDELPNDFSVWESLTNPKDVEESWEIQKKLLNKEIERFITEFKMKHKDGHWVDIQSKAEAFFNEEGKAVRIVGNHTNISERKKAEEALRESENRYRHLFNNAQIGIYRTNVEDGQLIEANQRMAELLEYKTVQDALDNYKTSEHYTDETEREELIKLLAEKGEFHNYEALIKINNKIKCFRFSGKLFKEEGYIQGVAEDITEQKKGELILKQYEKIVSSSGDALSLLDKDYRYKIVNNAYEKYSGLSQEELTGKTVEEYLGAEFFKEKIKPLFDRCLQGESIKFSDWFEYKNLGKRFVTVSYYPYYNDKNEIDGVVASTVDITNLKIAEEDLKNKMSELQRMNRIMIGRENKMFDLKKEINELLEKLGEDKKYTAPDEI